jgi:hypothetical protein
MQTESDDINLHNFTGHHGYNEIWDAQEYACNQSVSYCQFSLEVSPMLKSFIYRIAFLCVLFIGTSLAGFSQRPGSTAISGGRGGLDFEDVDIPSGSRVLEIRVFSGKFVDAIQMTYALPDGRELMGPRHGGEGGRESIFHIDSDEYVTGLSGRYGDYIDSLQIQTNKRKSPLFGGRGGEWEYRIDVPDGNQAVGFAGRAGKYVDSIGLVYAPLKIQQISQTSIAGGRGGEEFSDTDIPSGARLVEVRIRHSKYVNSIQAVYMLKDGRIFVGPMHGSRDGSQSVFRLDSDEYLTGITGRYGLYVDSLSLQTNKRTSQTFGGRGGEKNFKVTVPDGNHAIGFAGRAGKYLDAIALSYTTMGRQSQRRRGNRFRVED